MSSAYDSKTTTFSPEGRLYQVEYAVAGVSKAPTAVGVMTTEGIVFVNERRAKTKLLDTETRELTDLSGEKVYKVDDHLAVAVAGLTADANLLVDVSRRMAHRYQMNYSEPLPAEDLCQHICDYCQYYTQNGSVRPMGVAFLIAAWDRAHGFQLYHTDPSGNYQAWKVYAVGQNDEAARGVLKQEWKQGLTLKDGVLLALKVLGKTMDTQSLNAERLECSVLTRQPKSPAKFHIYTTAELAPFVAEAEELRLKEEREREEKRKAAAALD